MEIIAVHHAIPVSGITPIIHTHDEVALFLNQPGPRPVDNGQSHTTTTNPRREAGVGFDAGRGAWEAQPTEPHRCGRIPADAKKETRPPRLRETGRELVAEGFDA